jgi:ABC-type branched-subunit amino acid transport system substrate-binding protein
MDIHGLLRRFDVKVFGYPLLRELDNLDPRYFFDLNMLLYSTYWIDYDKPNVRQFNANYRTTFFTQPSETSFAWQGYDIAYYFISGLSLHGKDFLRNPSMHRPDLLHTDFYFVSRSNQDGYENHKLFPIRFTREFDVFLEE